MDKPTHVGAPMTGVIVDIYVKGNVQYARVKRRHTNDLIHMQRDPKSRQATRCVC
jgi:hypothetical protein